MERQGMFRASIKLKMPPRASPQAAGAPWNSAVTHTLPLECKACSPVQKRPQAGVWHGWDWALRCSQLWDNDGVWGERDLSPARQETIMEPTARVRQAEQ